MDHQLLDGTAAPSPANHPVLQRGSWNRRFGRYDFHRFDHTTSEQASVGGASIGKVEVDCKLLFKKSKWGLLDGSRPAGIIYMDLDFRQPQGYVLEWATVQVSLDDQTPHYVPSATPLSRPFDVLGQYPIQMTPWFGPQHIVGPERVMHKSQTIDLKPNVQVAGNGVGGVGRRDQATFEIPYRWKFTGSLVRPSAKKPGGGQYKTLEWELKENDLEPGQTNKIHTAFTFEYGGQPFFMKVVVKGGLKKLHHQFKHNLKSMKFGPRPNKNEDVSTTLVNAYHGNRLPLDALARGLDNAMEMENYKRRPLELPNPQTATYQEIRPGQATPNSPHIEEAVETDYAPPRPPERVSSAGPRPSLQPAQDTERVESLRASLLSVPADRTIPSLRNLARAGQEFIHPAREPIQEDSSDVSVVSSSRTLVDQQDEQSFRETSRTEPKYQSNAIMERIWIWAALVLQLFMEMIGISHIKIVLRNKGLNEGEL